MSDVAVPGHLRRVLDPLPQPLLLVDLGGRILHVNPACAELLQSGPGTLRDRRLDELAVGDHRHVQELLDLWARSAQPRPGALRIATGDHLEPAPIHAEGFRVPELDLLLVRLREGVGALHGFDELSREVETRNLRQMKHRLEETIEELRSANRRLEGANEELDRYAAVVSHDLRTPLTTIAGFVELLQMDHGEDLDEDGQHILQILRRNTERMAAAIDALLELARTEEPPRYVEPVDPVDVVRDVLEQIGADVRGADIVIGDTPAVAMDATHLSQVLQNLLVNSLRYRSPDRPLRVTVAGRPRDGMVELTVSDTGIGIPPEERERVFEPLKRGRHVQDIEGTGIGLATCRKIVRSYGGDIAVVDRGGPGTTIRFTAPAG